MKNHIPKNNIPNQHIQIRAHQIDEILESLAVGQELGGDCRIILFVVLRPGAVLSDQLKQKIKQRIRQNASPHHVPAEIVQVTDLPRTQSGKIAELAVRDILHGRPVTNRHALANPESLEQFLRIKALLSWIFP